MFPFVKKKERKDERIKTLDPRLKMSKMTERDRVFGTGAQPRPQAPGMWRHEMAWLQLQKKGKDVGFSHARGMPPAVMPDPDRASRVFAISVCQEEGKKKDKKDHDPRAPITNVGHDRGGEGAG